MTLLIDGDRPVHFPADSGKFSFDSEVSAIFHDMARRSIPNFFEAHAAHARMLGPWMRPGVRILDIGASRGAFLQALETQYPGLISSGKAYVVAVDNSESMCDYLRSEFPHADVRNQSVTGPEFRSMQERFDVVCCHYTLQFVHPDYQTQALHKIIGAVRRQGVFIYGHKAQYHGQSGSLAHEEYIRFRMANGYTREEIEAKTRALKGSMFPLDHQRLLNVLQHSFDEVTETYRFMMFSTLFAVK